MPTATWLRSASSEAVADAALRADAVTRRKFSEGNGGDADDVALFRAAVGAVTPLAGQNRVVPPRAPLAAIVRGGATPQAVADRLSDFSASPPPAEFLHNGVPRQTLRKLRRGLFPVEGELDLHGYQSDAARHLLQSFLLAAVQRELRCVRVIHGKGMNSLSGEAVLRGLTRNWLTQHPDVLAFCAATPEMGGEGAVLLLLKRNPQGGA